MKCPECEQTGQRSKLYMPDCYVSTAMGGSERFYDEDGHLHYHEVNHRSGRACCSAGHVFNVSASTKCQAPNCNYGHEQTFTMVLPKPAEPEPEYITFHGIKLGIPREPGSDES